MRITEIIERDIEALEPIAEEAWNKYMQAQKTVEPLQADWLKKYRELEHLKTKLAIAKELEAAQ